MKSKVLTLALTIAAAAPAIADDFTYLSGGLLYHNRKDSATDPISPPIPSAIPGVVAPKEKMAGWYLNGSLGVGDYLSVEGRFYHSRLEQQALVGLGAHYPVTQLADIYALAGVTQKRVTIYMGKRNRLVLSEGLDLEGMEMSFEDDFRPTIEVGTKLRLNTLSSARLSYRYALFKDKETLSNERRHLHAIHLGGDYQVTDSCAVEVGYNFTRFLKDINDHKITAGIRYSF